MSRKSKVYDVVIVGAGPVGLYTACTLAREGIEVLTIDRKEKVGLDVVCTGVVGTELFKKFSLPTDPILREIKTIRFISPSGISILYESPSPVACVINREEFDTLLLRCALENGAQMVLGSEAQSVEVEKKCVRVITKNGCEGEHSEYRARVAVLATGVNTRIQRMVGLGFPQHYLTGVHASAQMENDGVVSVMTGSFLSKGGFGWIVPVGKNKIRVGLMTQEEPHAQFKLLCERFLKAVPVSPKFRPIAQGLVSKTFSDRLISVGECAGQIKTTTGGGIYYGLIASKIAAETLLGAFKKGDFTAKTLISYEKGWKAKLGMEIKIGLSIRRIWSSLDDKQIEDLFMAVASNGIVEYVLKNVRFDWHVPTIWKLIQKKEIRALLGHAAKLSGTDF